MFSSDISSDISSDENAADSASLIAMLPFISPPGNKKVFKTIRGFTIVCSNYNMLFILEKDGSFLGEKMLLVKKSY